MDKWIKKSSDDDIKKFLQMARDDDKMQAIFEEEIEILDPPDAIGDALKQRIDEYDQAQSKQSWISHFFESVKKQVAVQPLRFALPGFATVLILLAGIVIIRLFLQTGTIDIASADIKGLVYIQRNSIELDVVSQNEIHQGDTIVTGSDGFCHIETDSGFKQALTLENDTSLTFQQILHIGRRSTTLFLHKGASSFEITKGNSDVNLIVKTNLAKIEVTGTRFHVQSMQNTTISVSEGVVRVTPENNRIKPFFLEAGEQVSIFAGESTRPEIIPYNTDNSSDITKEKVDKQWSVSKIFSFNYAGKPFKNRVLGFASGSRYSVGLSEAEIVWWNSGTTGKYTRKVYGEDGGMYFKSTPQITNTTAHIVSINGKMLQIDLQNGNESIINIPGFISYGYKMLYHAETGDYYAPLSNGIYRFNMISSDKVKSPLIPWNSPSTPLLIDNRLYVSSFLEPENNIGCFDLSGKMIWKKSLLQTAFCPLTRNGNFLYICDTAGMIYKISLDGNLEKKAILPEVVTARMTAHGTRLYALADDGWLYWIDARVLTVKKLFKVDDRPEKSIYLFKAPFVDNDKLLIGTDRGTLLVYDTVESTTTEFPLGSDQVSVTSQVCRYNDTSWLIGDKKGTVFIVKYQ